MSTRAKTVTELEAENMFLVTYLRDMNGTGLTERWTGRGPNALLAFIFMANPIEQTHCPYSQFEYETAVNFMKRLPEHLREIAQPQFDRLEQFWFNEKENKDRDAALRAKNINPHAYRPEPTRMR